MTCSNTRTRSSRAQASWFEDECTGTLVLSNTVAHNDFGLRVTECLSTTIQGNHAEANLRSGIHIQDASGTVMVGNEAIQNSGSGNPC